MTPGKNILLMALCMCFSLNAMAVVFGDAQSSRVDYRAVVAGPAMRCQDLNAITTQAFTVIKAKMVDGACRVRGVIPSEIRFEVNLPDQWNGRMMMRGNGGLAGQSTEDTGYQTARDLILSQGFALAYTDAGHDRRVEPGATFAFKNLHKLIDYGYRAVHLTSQTGRQLISQYYGQQPAHAYFMGCSNGGRQGLMAAQRFPDDFDGILAGAPANEFTGLKFSQAQRMQALSQQPLDLAEVNELATHIYQQCDGLDGQLDGLLDDPRACPFDPANDLPQCTGADRVDCFSEEEILSLKAYYAPVVVAGQQVYPGFLVGSEMAGPNYGGGVMSGWVPWVINPQGRPLLDVLGSDFFRYISFVKDDPDYDWNSFSFATMPDNIDDARAILDATEADLGPFQSAGGKLLSYFGWADPDINPLTAIAYHEAVASAVPGDVGDFYKLFMVPGMFHCAGGPGPSDFDGITPLINWVEAGVAPDRLEARHLSEGKVSFERPLCAYPDVARLTAQVSGDYVCQKPAPANEAMGISD
jgi:pimeloyl-ACP methyl ester carboxylesterase